MAKGKYEKWLEADNLTLLTAWARDGLTDEEIAAKCGISRSTLSEWKVKFEPISNALKKGKEVVDVEVEDSLHNSAIGYKVTLKKVFKVRRVEYDETTGRKLREYEDLEEREEEEWIPANVTAQIFWLKNRKPAAWRDRPEPAEEEKPFALELVVEE